MPLTIQPFILPSIFQSILPAFRFSSSSSSFIFPYILHSSPSIHSSISMCSTERTDWIHRQAGRQTDSQTDRQAHRQTDQPINVHPCTWASKQEITDEAKKEQTKDGESIASSLSLLLMMIIAMTMMMTK